MLVLVLGLTAAGAYFARDWYGAAEEETGGPAGETLPLAEQPGSPTVELSPDATAHPLGESVRQLLQTYFDAINGRNFDRWQTTVTADRVAATSEQQWLNDYDSTQDGSILVYRIESAPRNTLRVQVGFTSKQDIAQAPADLQVECINWYLALPVTKQGGQWKIAEAEPGGKQVNKPC
ncbi:hypothetical protein EV191_102199 [Tamaricihabitans halophyticus]|uniref:Uncharacterized protein n=1 Tax=Tamaricihabitans halophyticus TaxID=1262583 RepID=A0A4R2R0L8_9PSEU|nr:hypothetical protein EV191_102199 [Tamaricihabitans halophyticus]